MSHGQILFPPNNGISVNTKYTYVYLCNNFSQPQKALKTFETLPDEYKKNI